MLQIADLTFVSPFILAPLAGYTDLPFRQLCREFGAGLVVSEMISCHGLAYRQANTLAMLASNPAERPVSFQLFGADPAIMGQAAAILSTFHPDLIDINMGCPVKKVTKRGAGAALMQDPPLARAIITSVIKNSRVPVTVKTRIGVDSQHISAVDFAKMAEDAGVAAVTIHGRTWAQGFTGTADWDIIAQVKQAVSCPIIGNGDIHSHAQGLEMMRQTGCDGIMIGRAALG
ncbi:MAG: tRNA dihydrouridine synthase DusB, partial [Desulfocapsaceae bacterium]|nr:tRNA dihydrouridine synthase DusB [Desulfocapsaceae bacterium]